MEMTAMASALTPRVRLVRNSREAGLSRGRESKSLSSAIGAEHVALAPDRLNEGRMGGVALDLTAQARHPDIDGAIKGGPLRAGQQVQKLIPIEHPIGMLSQHHQQIEL